LVARTVDTFKRMAAVTKALGILGIITITLLYYLGMGKVFRKR
jgi:hypothetical protein